MMASLSAVARRFGFVRETGGPNIGAWVSVFQRFAGGQDGDSWCADFVSFLLDVAYHGKSPLKKTGSTQALLAEARVKGFVVTTPQPDDLYFYVNDAGHAHHVGIVTGVNPLIGLSGNTSPDGLSVNGTGVFEHPLSVDPTHLVFVRLPRTL